AVLGVTPRTASPHRRSPAPRAAAIRRAASDPEDRPPDRRNPRRRAGSERMRSSLLFRREGHLALLPARHHLVPLSPIGAHLKLVVVMGIDGPQRLLARVEPLRDVVPLRVAVLIAELAQLQHLYVVGRGEAAGSEEGECTLDPELAQER